MSVKVFPNFPAVTKDRFPEAQFVDQSTDFFLKAVIKLPSRMAVQGPQKGPA